MDIVAYLRPDTAARAYLQYVIDSRPWSLDTPAIAAEADRLAATAPDFRPVGDPRAEALATALLGWIAGYEGGYREGLCDGTNEGLEIAQLRIGVTRAQLTDGPCDEQGRALLDRLAAAVDADRPRR